MRPQVSVLAVPSYDEGEVMEAVETHLRLNRFSELLRPGATVLLKPNLLMKRAPETATTTHPAFVAAVVRALRALGAGEITVADSPGGPYTAAALEGVYAASGMAAAEAAGARLNRGTGFRPVPSAGKAVSEFSLIDQVAGADLVINLPKLKTHGMTGMSGAVKNLFGCIPGLQKPELHFQFPEPERFSAMLVDLALTVRPSLTIVDGIDAMEGNGPSGGEVRRLGLTFASRDPFALDLIAAAALGMAPGEVTTLAESIRRGLCPASPGGVDLLGGGFRTVPNWKRAEGKALDFADHAPAALRPALRKLMPLLAPRPAIRTRDCVGCGKCAESCPAKVIRITGGKAVIRRRGCIRCFCCHEMCPVRAVDIRRSPLLHGTRR